MSKIKKIIIFLIVGIVLLTGILLTTFYLMLNKVSTIVTMDINPSIAIILNYKNDVLKVEGLNEDGKELIKDHNLKGASLKQALETVTEKVIEKGYIKENDNHILINVKGEDIKEEVVTLINKEFEEKNTTCNIITQEINETAKENAEKYGITESKASYIENLIKENTELKFEDLKDKTINEINQIIKENIKDTDKEVEKEDKEEVKEEKEEDKKEENKPSGSTGNNTGSSTNKPSGTTSNNKKPSTSSYTCPTSPSNANNVWCDYIDRTENEAFAIKYNCKMDEKKDYETLRQMALKHLGIQSIDARGQYSYPHTDKRSSYCSAQTFIITTLTTRTTLIMDSVTGEVIEENSIPVVIKLSEEDAVDALLKHYNLNREDLESYSTWFSTDNEGADFVYRYNVYLTMKDGTRYSNSVNANTGKIIIY